LTEFAFFGYVGRFQQSWPFGYVGHFHLGISTISTEVGRKRPTLLKTANLAEKGKLSQIWLT
jgi:hypothetical protein